MTTNNKPKIIPEAVEIFKRACELRNAPIPADPVRRILENREYNKACDALREALGRHRYQADIFETIGDEMPMHVVRAGPAAVLDFNEAAAIRRELERLARGRQLRRPFT
jgi:hypothetical protein